MIVTVGLAESIPLHALQDYQITAVIYLPEQTIVSRIHHCAVGVDSAQVGVFDPIGDAITGWFESVARGVSCTVDPHQYRFTKWTSLVMQNVSEESTSSSVVMVIESNKSLITRAIPAWAESVPRLHDGGLSKCYRIVQIRAGVD